MKAILGQKSEVSGIDAANALITLANGLARMLTDQHVEDIRSRFGKTYRPERKRA